MQERFSKAVRLALDLRGDALMASSPGAGSIVDSGVDELMGQLASSGALAILLTAMLFKLDDARDKAGQEPGIFVRRMWTEMETWKDHNIAEWDGVLSRYYSVMQFNRGIVIATGEPYADHNSTLTQWLLLFKKKHKMKRLFVGWFGSKEGLGCRAGVRTSEEVVRIANITQFCR